ncbi:MAG TPA: TPM domain-containing protein, partial [Candidatus Obscuribacterales bacterium]
MSDDLRKQAPFLPAAPPRQAIIDLSGSLSQDQVAALEAQAARLTYKAKVVVLPKDFTAADPQQFARQLAERWDVEAGRRFLLVVDLKAHKVRGLSSAELNASGVTSSAISQDIIANNFIPYMRKGDLEGAISHSLAAVEKTLTARTAAVSQADGRPY